MKRFSKKLLMASVYLMLFMITMGPGVLFNYINMAVFDYIHREYDDDYYNEMIEQAIDQAIDDLYYHNDEISSIGERNLYNMATQSHIAEKKVIMALARVVTDKRLWSNTPHRRTDVLHRAIRLLSKLQASAELQQILAQTKDNMARQYLTTTLLLIRSKDIK